jgi:hypothetical protein
MRAWDQNHVLKVLMISSYELGRQPFWLAWPAAWLTSNGADVACAVLPVEPPRSPLCMRFIGTFVTLSSRAKAKVPRYTKSSKLSGGWLRLTNDRIQS